MSDEKFRLNILFKYIINIVIKLIIIISYNTKNIQNL